MPIDASVPLSVHQFKAPTALDYLSLKDLATRSQINQQSLEQKTRENQQQNALLKLLQSPGSTDPQTGRLTPQALAGITQINPQKGIELEHQQRALTLQDMQFNDKKMQIGRNWEEAGLSAYDRTLQETGNKDAATKAFTDARNATINEQEQNGMLRSAGFNQAEIDRARQQQRPIDQTRALVTAMGGSIAQPPKQEHVVASNPETSTGLGFLDPRTREFLKGPDGKTVAAPPTLQATMANVKIPQSDKEFWADVIRKGGSLPPGLARSGVGAKLVSEVMQEVPKTGIKPNEMLANQAEFVGEKAGQRTLGTRTANIEMAATEARGLADLARTASDEWNRSDIRSFNDLQRIAQDKTKSPELRRAVGATTSFINAYARAINPQGVGTVADKEHAMQMISPAFAKGDYAAAIDQLIKEIETAQKSPGKVKENMRNRFLGKQEETAQNKAPQGALDYLQAHPESKDHFKAKYGYLP